MCGCAICAALCIASERVVADLLAQILADSFMLGLKMSRSGGLIRANSDVRHRFPSCVSLYQTCAESLASENASRLIAMQRAEKNIEEMLGDLRHEYHHQRQDAIDTELFDVVAGYTSEN